MTFTLRLFLAVGLSLILAGCGWLRRTNIMSTTQTMHTALAQWEKRENMGASPIAIHTAELIREDLATLPAEMHGIAIAALVDAAFRKTGVPELLAALSDLLSFCEIAHYDCTVLTAARAAIQKARGGK